MPSRIAKETGTRINPSGITVTSPKSVTFAVGQRGTFTVTTDANPAVTVRLAKIGRLARGVRFTDKRNGTALISGAPPLGTVGVYTIVIRALAVLDGSRTDSAFTLVVETSRPPTKESGRATPFKRANVKKAGATKKAPAKKANANKAASEFKRAPAKKATASKRISAKKTTATRARKALKK